MLGKGDLVGDVDARGRFRILRTFGPFEGKEGVIDFDREEAREFVELGWIEEVTVEEEAPAEAEPAPKPKRAPRKTAGRKKATSRKKRGG
jgi:hypothetical protein